MTMPECASCGEWDEQCAKAKRKCGHHCNHVWSHDVCCWCDKKFSTPEDAMAAIQYPKDLDDNSDNWGTA